MIARAQVITTIAGSDSTGLGDGGAATSCRLAAPVSVFVDAAGNIYICDTQHHRLRKVNVSGIITTIAGNGISGYSGDGGPATAAQLNTPIALDIDLAGNIYIADVYNQRIRKITPDGIISTVAGTGVAGYNGDNIAATTAQIKSPHGVVADAGGNIYVTEIDGSRIRRIDGSGIITTVAGTGIDGFSGDGGAASTAQISGPYGITIDHDQNLYIAEVGNQRIRKISATGIITTIAGNGVSDSYGNGGAATNAAIVPVGVKADGAGNIYVTDAPHAVVRMINTEGVIVAVAGVSGDPGYNGDGIQAISAKLRSPTGVTVDAANNIYISDLGNNRIRRLRSNVLVNEADRPVLSVNVSPNPNKGFFTMRVGTQREEEVRVTITDVAGRKVKELNVASNKTATLLLDVPTGIYIISAQTRNGNAMGKIIVGQK